MSEHVQERLLELIRHAIERGRDEDAKAAFHTLDLATRDEPAAFGEAVFRLMTLAKSDGKIPDCPLTTEDLWESMITAWLQSNGLDSEQRYAKLIREKVTLPGDSIAAKHLTAVFVGADPTFYEGKLRRFIAGTPGTSHDKHVVRAAVVAYATHVPLAKVLELF